MRLLCELENTDEYVKEKWIHNTQTNNVNKRVSGEWVGEQTNE